MARYTGPKAKKARSLGEAIFGSSGSVGRAFERKKYAPGQHGVTKKRKQRSDYAVQLNEKQKAKYTYGLLERQFRKTFDKASRNKGVTGEVLLQLLEARLDNIVFRLGIAPTRRAARQLVNHGHILMNGVLTDIPSATARPGDVISIRNKSRKLDIVRNALLNTNASKGFGWLEWNADKAEGVFLSFSRAGKHS
jgi:SSU ribosomal protein S4P